MHKLTIILDNKEIEVQLMGASPKLIPLLLKAIKQNKLTLSKETFLTHLISSIDLYCAEAILHFEKGLKVKIPIF
jgi:hypothetical protein